MAYGIEPVTTAAIIGGIAALVSAGGGVASSAIQSRTAARTVEDQALLEQARIRAAQTKARLALYQQQRAAQVEMARQHAMTARQRRNVTIIGTTVVAVVAIGSLAYVAKARKRRRS